MPVKSEAIFQEDALGNKVVKDQGIMLTVRHQIKVV